MNCLCHSTLPYKECCGAYIEGNIPPENTLKLMRSRYCAFALGRTDYIINTTHPENPDYKEDKIIWKRQLISFSSRTDFVGLDILNFIDGESEAFVTFFAHLRQKNTDSSFQEKSRFIKKNGLWLYHSFM